MSINDGDILFVYLNSNSLKPPKYAAFGFSLGILNDFDNYIFGYKEAAIQLYNRFADSDSSEINIHDTLVFPLCFLYRHLIEIYIKYFYMKYADVTKDACITFLNASNHHLITAWDSTLPFLHSLVDRFPSCGFSLYLCGCMIKQIDDFDGDSMRMRYPITKKLVNTNETPILLDVDHLHKKMMELVDYFDAVNCYFDNVLINNETYSVFRDRFMSEIWRSKTLFLAIVETVERYQTVPNGQSKCSSVDLADVQSIDKMLNDELCVLMRDADMNQVVTIMILLYTGRDLAGHSFKLSETPKERTKDLLKGLELTQQELNNQWFDQPDTMKWDVCEKLLVSAPKYLISWLTQIRTSWNTCFPDRLI